MPNSRFSSADGTGETDSNLVNLSLQTCKASACTCMLRLPADLLLPLECHLVQHYIHSVSGLKGQIMPSPAACQVGRCFPADSVDAWGGESVLRAQQTRLFPALAAQ